MVAVLRLRSANEPLPGGALYARRKHEPLADENRHLGETYASGTNSSNLFLAGARVTRVWRCDRWVNGSWTAYGLETRVGAIQPTELFSADIISSKLSRWKQCVSSTLARSAGVNGFWIHGFVT